MAYASWSVVFGEQPTAAKWNILGTNDASFNDGTGIITANATSATVATSETTTSTSFVDLTTTTDTVTVTVGTNGKVLLSISCSCANSTSAYSIASFAASGANTIAAADTQAIFTSTGSETQGSWDKLIRSLTPGSTTFKMKYRVTAGTGTFKNRNVSVIPY